MAWRARSMGIRSCLVRAPWLLLVLGASSALVAPRGRVGLAPRAGTRRLAAHEETPVLPPPSEEAWCPLGECEVVYEKVDDDAEQSLRQRLQSWVFRGRARRAVQPGKLILIRHGETTWNANRTFSGWVDVDLNGVGEAEVEHAARLMMERGLTIDVVYTSLLKRAIRSAWISGQDTGDSTSLQRR